MSGGPSTAKRCIHLDPADNTATALLDLEAGEAVEAAGPEPATPLILRQPIPYAHKFALAFIAKGRDVLKYGEVIGSATRDIEAGEHVHVHNVVGKRARGGV
jgi:altronate dehydratase small subunit